MKRPTRRSAAAVMIAGACLVLQIPAGAASPPPAPPDSAGSAASLAAEVVAASQGAAVAADRWAKAGALKFTVETTEEGKPVSTWNHIWDLKSGQYRVEGADAGLKQKVYLFNINTREGSGYVQAPMLVADEATGDMGVRWMMPPGIIQKRFVQIGYDRYIRDTRALLLPLKLAQPGVTVEHQGTKEVGATTYDVLKAKFARTAAVAPQTWIVLVDKKTHLPERVEVETAVATTSATVPITAPANAAPKGSEPNLKIVTEEADTPPDDGIWLWSDWKSYGPLRVATVRNTLDGKRMVKFKDIEVLPSVPEGAFVPPGPLLRKSPPTPPPPAAPSGAPVPEQPASTGSTEGPGGH